MLKRLLRILKKLSKGLLHNWALRRFCKVPFVSLAKGDLGPIDRLLYYEYLAIYLEELGAMEDLMERYKKFFEYTKKAGELRGRGSVKMDIMESDGLFPSDRILNPYEILSHIAKDLGIAVRHDMSVCDFLILAKALKQK